MRETTRHRLAFDLYVGLGANRSLEKLRVAIAADLGRTSFRKIPGIRSLYPWSTELHWQGRFADLERQARRRDTEALLQQLLDMNRLQADRGLTLQWKGAERLHSLDPDEMSAADAIRALVEGVRMARLARRDITARTEVERNDHLDLGAFSLAELRALARVLLAVRQTIPLSFPKTPVFSRRLSSHSEHEVATPSGWETGLCVVNARSGGCEQLGGLCIARSMKGVSHVSHFPS